MLPVYLEQLIHEGKAAYKSISMGLCQEMIIPVKSNTYIVVYEHHYLPLANSVGQTDLFDRDLIQFVSYVNGTNLNHYSHALDLRINTIGGQSTYQRNSGHQKREMYIIAKANLAVYFSCLNVQNAVFNQFILDSDPPIQDLFGYANLPAVTSIEGYVDDFFSGRFLAPLTDEYSLLQYNGTASNYNQLSTLPGGGGALDLAPLIVDGALGKSRGNHIVINYVEIYTQPPVNVI